MADVKCAVCGEPYDVHHGEADMTKWEYELFKKGAGCPCCEGIATGDAGDRELETLRGLVMDGGDDDETNYALSKRLGVMADTGEPAPRPEWKRPEPIVHETCAGCGLRIVTNPDDGQKVYDTAQIKRDYYSAAYYEVHGYEFMRDAERDCTESFVSVDPDNKDDTDVYCPACIEVCANGNCQHMIFRRSELEPGDTYAPGQSFPDPQDEYHGGAVCIDCYEQLSAEDEEEDEDDEDDEDSDDEEENETRA